MAIEIQLFLVPRERDAVFGLWCPTCLKPSGYKMPFDRITPEGVTPTALTLQVCYDCEKPIR